MDNNSELLSHIIDLADRSYKQNFYTFSNFLSLGEQSFLLQHERDFNFVPFEFFGGVDGCERRIIRFGSLESLGFDEPFPITVLIIKPLMLKFSDPLTHRDFLGAVMNLGINRDVLGDIVIRDNIGYIFCLSSIAGYLSENLTKIRHTSVSCEISDICPDSVQPQFAPLQITVSSNRSDAVISGVYNLSRNQSSELFRKQLIYIDGRVILKSDLSLNDGAVVSVRGYGKFIFDGVIGDTRKGRIRIAVRKYI